MPGPWGPAAAIAPACVVAVPPGSSTRDRLTSGSPLEEAEVAVEVATVGVALVAAVTTAAGSSGPTSHTRVTTTGVDELAWAARSCSGLVRAGMKKRQVTKAQSPEQKAETASPGVLCPNTNQ